MAKTKAVTKATQAKELKKYESDIGAVIANAAANPQVDVDKMRAILDMQTEIFRRKADLAYSQAMRSAQEEIHPVVRRTENTHTKSKFAKLEHIDEEIRPIYTRHGFSISYDYEERTGDKIRVFAYVRHDAGHTQIYKLDGDLDCTGSQGKANKTKMQGLGSSVSYLRRYLICMIFNIVLTDEDDDGVSGSKPPEVKSRFAEKIKNDQAGQVVDAEYEEQPADNSNERTQPNERFYISIDGVNQHKEFTTAGAAGNYLKAVISKRNHKQSRIDIVAENAPLLRAINAAGGEALVAELHQIAGEGK